MIGSELDSRTLTLMNIALDHVCTGMAGGGDHATRKRAAKQIVRRAKNGPVTLTDLIAAGQRGLRPCTIDDGKDNQQLGRPHMRAA